MPNKHLLMRLSPEEETYLRHWMSEETHYREGSGLAKSLQLRNRVKPADLAALIAAAYPDTVEQEAAGAGPRPSGKPTWPWSEDEFRVRLEEARHILAGRQHATTNCGAEE